MIVSWAIENNLISLFYFIIIILLFIYLFFFFGGGGYSRWSMIVIVSVTVENNLVYLRPIQVRFVIMTVSLSYLLLRIT